MTDEPGAPPSQPRSRGSTLAAWLVPLTLVALAAASFLRGLADEPHFADESAYIAQAYYARLFVEGRWDDHAWLEYPAYDLPPLPKYLIGAGLKLGGHRLFGPGEAYRWYRDINRRFETPAELTAARVPIALVGVLGCLAAYGLGTLAGGRCAGWIAGAILAIDPLYRMLARRAMSDVPCEAFVLSGLFLGLLAWRRWLAGKLGATFGLAVAAAGAMAGLALLCKMSGILTLIVLGAWGLGAVAWRRRPVDVVVLATTGLLAIVTAAFVFLALDPYLTAEGSAPIARARSTSPEQMTMSERVRAMVELRVQVAQGQQKHFPHNALLTYVDKLSTALVQGFGRFGPLGPSHTDSTIRYDWSQDYGSVLWLPGVVLGGIATWLRGRDQARRGAAPTAWAVLVQFALTFAVVTLYLPMAWDRYFLALQAPAALLFGIAVDSSARRLIPSLARARPGGGSTDALAPTP